jgi:nucleoside-diphosphate-sugar epimerase
MKKALVCGAGGFIGGHMVKRLVSEGYKVVAVDIKPLTEWYQISTKGLSEGLFDLRKAEDVNRLIQFGEFDEVYQLAADMGGAGYIFTGDNDAAVMHNSATINLNVAHAISCRNKKPKVFYSSSACVYPGENQTDPNNPNCVEDSAYPANPDSEYGWEKLFSERMWRAFARNHTVEVRIARFHNIFGPYGTWTGGKEKAPAAMCRKALEVAVPKMSATMMDEARVPRPKRKMEVWGPGTQTRSFMYIDECVEAVRRLMESDVTEVINIGSDEMISINDLAKMALEISDRYDVEIVNVEGPVGVMGRCSDNFMIEDLLDWRPTMKLREGMKKTLEWIKTQM